MKRKYPPLGHYFKVEVDGFSDELGFQSVSRLSSSVEFEDIREGGNQMVAYKAPVRITYSDVTLKRGLLAGSSLVATWIRRAMEQFYFEPRNVTITLLDSRSGSQQMPLATWQLLQAVPKSWELSDLNAQENAIAIESLVLTFQELKQKTS